MTFGERLTALRKEKGYSVRNDFAEYLGIPTTTLRNYEKGDREPGHSFLIQMSELFNVSIDYLLGTTEERERVLPCDLKSHEIEHIKKYRNLDDYGKETVDIILDRETTRVTALSELENSVKDMQTVLKKTPAAMRIYTYLHKIAAAGTGFYFEDIPTDTIEAPYCEDADFIIGVNGDSMEPTYNDGDLVYVEKCQIVNTGDVGIFIVNNELYIKEAGENGLISHNSKYDPIPGSENILCVGKVLKKVNVD